MDCYECQSCIKHIVEKNFTEVKINVVVDDPDARQNPLCGSTNAAAFETLALTFNTNETESIRNKSATLLQSSFQKEENLAMLGLQDSTLHGIYYMSRARSKKALAFWSVITFAALVYATVQVMYEIRQISSNTQFNVHYRTATKTELQMLWSEEVSVRYVNFFDTIDWDVVRESASTLNMTIDLAFDIIERFGWKNDIPVKCASAGKSATFNRIDSNVYFRCPFPHQVGLIIMEHRNRKSESDLDSGISNFYSNEERNDYTIVFSILFTRVNTKQNSIVNNRYHFYFGTENLVHLHILPKLSNYPTTEKMECQTPWSLSRKRGIDCFHWDVEPNILEKKKIALFSNIPFCNRTNDIYGSCTYLHIESSLPEKYLVEEFVQIFQLYAIIANIGGALGVWTGASNV
uniref:Uncharacterized protein n=1 Tax=Romanomermis culicivorax TaxID=13658 RepID=A0A915KQC1_ROMCU